mgnify:CR=1 FL=1
MTNGRVPKDVKVPVSFRFGEAAKAKLEALANKLHTAEAAKDQREWIACIDAIYRTAHLPPNASFSRGPSGPSAGSDS